MGGQVIAKAMALVRSWGDLDGVAVWRRIVGAINELQQEKLKPGERHHGGTYRGGVVVASSGRASRIFAAQEPALLAEERTMKLWLKTERLS